MHIDWMAFLAFTLLATAVAVGYYAKTALDQLEATRELIETAQRQLEAAQRQLEALHAPMLVPVAQSGADGGRLTIQNLGSGVALNVRYLHTGQASFAWPPGLTGAVACPPIGASATHVTPETTRAFETPHFFRIQYESLSGHRYQTEATIVGRADTVDVRLRKL